MTYCTHCKRLTLAALDASRAYYDLLRDLEAAHIRKEVNRQLAIREQVAMALHHRDASLAELAAHQGIHPESRAAGGRT